MVTVVRLTSSNFDGILVTKEAYKELVATMSTADFNTHKAEPVVVSEMDLEGVVGLEEVLEGEFDNFDY